MSEKVPTDGEILSKIVEEWSGPNPALKRAFLMSLAALVRHGGERPFRFRGDQNDVETSILAEKLLGYVLRKGLEELGYLEKEEV